MAMNNMETSRLVVEFTEEIDRLILLCTRITQSASKIQKSHLSKAPFSMKNLESQYHSLLSIAEGIEGSALLLETLTATQGRNFLSMEGKKLTRRHYTRDELLQLRRRVSIQLSDQIKTLLMQVVERESNDSVATERKSWRDIRTILM